MNPEGNFIILGHSISDHPKFFQFLTLNSPNCKKFGLLVEFK